MDRQTLGIKLLGLIGSATAVTAGGPLLKVWSIVQLVVNWLMGLPKDDIDYFIDLIEANNTNNKTVMVAMRIVRIILNCPDEPGEDQTNPV